MIAKILYLNWFKADREQRAISTMDGSLNVDKPELYDVVGEVETLPGETHERTCDRVWRMFNRVEEGDMEGMNIRSMCVGDVVLFDDSTCIVVQGCGWKEFKGFDKLAFWARPLVKEQAR